MNKKTLLNNSRDGPPAIFLYPTALKLHYFGCYMFNSRICETLEPLISLVPKVGLEPTQVETRLILSPIIFI